jgi:cell pole-organizing protein PopZ
MSSPSAEQHEPTMEEILASIRKIISEDSTEQPAQAAGGAEPADDADVLELTQEVAPEPAEALQPVPEPEPAPVEPAQVQSSVVEDDVVFEEIEEPTTMNEPAPADDGIFSDKTRSALDDAFAGLDEEPAAPDYAMPEGDSVQAVFERAVRSGFEPLLREHLNANTDALIEHMKPLIREWMDDNFPSLLESAVRTEVARAVKARGRR